MNPIAILAALAALACADVAGAAPAAKAPHRTAAHATPARLHKASGAARRRPRQHALRTTNLDAASAEDPASAYRTRDADQGLPGQPGWFRSEKEKEAGWGVDDHGTRVVAGIYQRPPQPGIPGPQTYHTPEGRGAAGLSFSLKLGN